jgi:hypothetical protein
MQLTLIKASLNDGPRQHQLRLFFFKIRDSYTIMENNLRSESWIFQGDDSKKILWAFETAHGTIPNNQIIQSCIKFLSDYRDKIKGAESKKHSDWEALSRVLLTSNSFLFVE